MKSSFVLQTKQPIQSTRGIHWKKEDHYALCLDHIEIAKCLSRMCLDLLSIQSYIFQHCSNFNIILL